MTAGVTVTVAKVPDPTGTDKVQVEATWPADGSAEWLVRMTGEGFADAARLAGAPRWSWTGFLAAGSYSLHVEGFEPAPFEVTPGRAAEQPDDPYGGHVFHYESYTDLFRCIRCHRYEVSARQGDGTIEPCAGEPSAGSGPIEVNAW